MDETMTIFDDHERRARRLITIIVSVVLLLTTIAALQKAMSGKSAFIRWRPQISDLVQGVDVYEKYTYPNTPVEGCCCGR